jgi:hypothetical protein
MQNCFRNETLPLSSARNHQPIDMKEVVHISLPVLKAETEVSCASFFRPLPITSYFHTLTMFLAFIKSHRSIIMYTRQTY